MDFFLYYCKIRLKLPPKNLVIVRNDHDLTKQGENLQSFLHNSPKSEVRVSDVNWEPV